MSLNMRGGLAVAGGLILGRFMVAPHDISLSANIVNENSSIGFVFSTAAASDMNSNEVFTWALTNDAGGKFAIHSTNGNLSVNGSLDFESASSHNITVQVTDKDGLTYSESFTINVSNVNEPPVDISVSSNQVWGMTPTTAVIGTASVTDPDAGDISTWTLQSNPGGLFAIHPTNGNITKNVKYFDSGNHSITIRATDTGSNIYDEAFNMNNSYLRFESSFTEVDGHLIDNWGRFLALDTDGDTMVVGAFTNNNLGVDAGAAFIYTRTGITWTKQATLIPATPRAPIADDYYGFAVAISGDGNTAVIGAHRWDFSGTNTGLFFVWKRSGVTWTQSQYFSTPASLNLNEHLGFDIKLTQDGSRLIVSEPFSSDGVNNPGQVHIYTRPDANTIYSYLTSINSPTPQNAEFLGHNLALTPDGNTLALNAPYRDTTHVDSGVIYVYTWNGSTYIHQSTLTNPTPATSEIFSAWALNISNDGNHLVTSSYAENSNTGASYYYSRTAGVWSSSTQIIPNFTPAAGSYFGYNPCLNADGDVLIVPSHQETVGGTANAGAVYIFTRSGSTWTQRQKIVSQVITVNGAYGSGSVYSYDGKYAAISCHGNAQRLIEVFRTGL